MPGLAGTCCLPYGHFHGLATPNSFVVPDISVTGRSNKPARLRGVGVGGRPPPQPAAAAARCRRCLPQPTAARRCTAAAADPCLLPEQTRPDQTRPGQARPGQARPNQAKPSQTKPGQARPGQAGSGQARPGRARPGRARPGQGDAVEA
eukprot:gene19723-biopygen17520